MSNTDRYRLVTITASLADAIMEVMAASRRGSRAQIIGEFHRMWDAAEARPGKDFIEYVYGPEDEEIP